MTHSPSNETTIGSYTVDNGIDEAYRHTATVYVYDSQSIRVTCECGKLNYIAPAPPETGDEDTDDELMQSRLAYWENHVAAFCGSYIEDPHDEQWMHMLSASEEQEAAAIAKISSADLAEVADEAIGELAEARALIASVMDLHRTVTVDSVAFGRMQVCNTCRTHGGGRVQAPCPTAVIAGGEL